MLGNNYKIYYFPAYNRKVYLDGSESEGYSYNAAYGLALDNAVSMPGKRIYLENGDTMKTLFSYRIPNTGSRIYTTNERTNETY